MSDGRNMDGAAGWVWTLALARLLIAGLSTLLDFLKKRLFSFAVGSVWVFGLLLSATFSCSSKDTVGLNSACLIYKKEKKVLGRLSDFLKDYFKKIGASRVSNIE